MKKELGIGTGNVNHERKYAAPPELTSIK